ncbi:VOC family protein [Ignatzschineria cameli]|uniref:Aldoketomutase n=1 Tax=Ignatzschineria cameli TaxID=2182793 RepID=A0A2U2AKZ7_9GAMM|nr:VOC family protein [Ignatzschineria cameli]PWD83818.1 lactoylglutathione lyase [Ignatzschineria cameli]PWD86100.1 lactoylglutathione lyase [Ignatzschineria cameli]PWD88389.1 lactoylglutathione lyase [Ignatzschineria cameli]PWD88907.1 lactoylglutathione lyase [Ignatzschineria cameli]PWD89624.1 lactoylglutathione lyase [Ignatzschineria cameli]
MRFLHTMIRVSDLEQSIKFFTEILGLKETRRKEYPQWECTLVYLACEGQDVEIELTYNWDSKEEYGIGRAFGHLAFEVDDIYEVCQRAMDAGIEINVPPRDGWMAFFRTPDDISIELLQKGEPKAPAAPWKDMENVGWW